MCFLESGLTVHMRVFHLFCEGELQPQKPGVWPESQLHGLCGNWEKIHPENAGDVDGHYLATF